MAQFWHTLKEDGSKYRLRFMLDMKDLTLSLDDFRTIFHLPQATDNNHTSFVPPPSFSDMIPFYKQHLGFTIELKMTSSFKTTGLLQPWQTLCKIFSKCLTTRVTGWDQPPLQIMQIRAREKYHNLQDDDIMKNIFNSGRHKDKVGMQIPAWMITEEMKHTKHFRMYAKVFGIDVPMTQSQPTESTQGTHRTPSAPRSPNPQTDVAESSAPKRSTVICFRLPERRSACLTPPTPVPTVEKADDIILQDTLQVSLTTKADKSKKQEKMWHWLTSTWHLKRLKRLWKVRKMLLMIVHPLGMMTQIFPVVESVDKEVEITGDKEEENADKPVEIASDKPNLEEEITNGDEDITNVVIPVNVDEDEDEITDEVYELKRREKGKVVEESRISPIPTPTRSPRNLSNIVSSDTKKLQELTVTHTTPSSSSPNTTEQVIQQVPEQVRNQVPVYLAEGLILERKKTNEETQRMIDKAILQERGNIQAQIQKAINDNIPSLVDASVRSYMSGHIFHVHPTQSQSPSVPEQQYQLYLAMKADP
ncbi:hypothetical protein Tco_0880198, partial [Tanacetum coccineum]